MLQKIWNHIEVLVVCIKVTLGLKSRFRIVLHFAHVDGYTTLRTEVNRVSVYCSISLHRYPGLNLRIATRPIQNCYEVSQTLQLSLQSWTIWCTNIIFPDDNQMNLKLLGNFSRTLQGANFHTYVLVSRLHQSGPILRICSDVCSDR